MLKTKEKVKWDDAPNLRINLKFRFFAFKSEMRKKTEMNKTAVQTINNFSPFSISVFLYTEP